MVGLSSIAAFAFGLWTVIFASAAWISEDELAVIKLGFIAVILALLTVASLVICCMCSLNRKS